MPRLKMASGSFIPAPHKDDVVLAQLTTFRSTALFRPAEIYLLVGGLRGLWHFGIIQYY